MELGAAQSGPSFRASLSVDSRKLAQKLGPLSRLRHLPPHQQKAAQACHFVFPGHHFSPNLSSKEQLWQPAIPLRLIPRHQARERSSLSSFLNVAMADEEPVDQKKLLEDACKPKCIKQFLAYTACVKRIQDDETGHKHCTGQYFDFWSCIDKCVASKLFSQLK